MKKTALILTSIVCLINAGAVMAIVPIDKFILVPVGVSGSVGVLLDGEAGNRKEQEYNIEGVLRYGWEDQSLTFRSDYNYTKTDGLRNEDDLFTHLRFVKQNYLAKSVDAEAFTQYEYDDFADLSRRVLLGGGARWRHKSGHNNRRLRTLFGAGAFYEVEDSKSSAVRNETIRANLYSGFRLNIDSVRPYELHATFYLQPSVEKLDDIRALLVTGIEFVITDSFSLGIDAEVNYDSDPFENVKDANLEYGVSLRYAF